MSRPGACLVAAALLLARSAHAEPSVEVAPLLAFDVPMGGPWTELVVRVGNPEDRPLRGTVDVDRQPGLLGTSYTARAAFVAEARGQATVVVPVHANHPEVVVRDDAGHELQRVSLSLAPLAEPAIVDVHRAPRLVGALNGSAVPREAEEEERGPSRIRISVAQARWSPTTHAPLLPEHAAGWSGVSAVVIGSDTLIALEDRAKTALTDWVLGGGTLAVSVVRPEDLRHPTLVALVGEAAPAPMPPLHLLVGPIGAARPPESAGDGGGTPLPSSTTVQHLRGYARGNLHATRLGATATYGLGEVDLLPFDTGSAEDLADPWSRAVLAELARHAVERAATPIAAHRHEVPGDGSLGEVTRELDPNDAAQWMVGAVAVALVLYALLVGPVSFAAAARANDPLRALRRLPIYAAIAFALVVAVGIGGRGLRGRARRLSLIDAGAGVSRAAVVRYRGFYLAEARELTVTASGAGAVLRATGDDAHGEPRVQVDRDGLRLAELQVAPRETTVVREDGTLALGDGLAVVAAGAGGATLVNRTGHPLVGVLLALPGASARFFARIAEDATVTASEGQELVGFAPAPSTSAKRARLLDLGPAAARMDEAARGLSTAWNALASATPAGADWFPSDVPVVLAQLDGGEGVTEDARLPLERDRALLRVVGWGGRP